MTRKGALASAFIAAVLIGNLGWSLTAAQDTSEGLCWNPPSAAAHHALALPAGR